MAGKEKEQVVFSFDLSFPRGWLSTAFRLAKAYFVPLSFRPREPGQIIPRLHRGKTIAKLAAAFAMNAAVQVATTQMLPTAEDYMKGRGLNPAIAAELSDHTVRIVPRNIWGQLYWANENPTLPGMIYSWNRYKPADPCDAQSFTPSWYSWKSHRAYLPDNECRVKQDIEASLWIPAEDIENIGITEHEYRDSVAFHEFAHTHTINSRSSDTARSQTMFGSELDADIRGFPKAAEAYKNPEILKAWMYRRAMNLFDAGHDSSLYLDALINNRAPPSVPEMWAARMEMAKKFDSRMAAYRNNNQEVTVFTMAEVMRSILREDANLSSLARRRIELYVEGIEYFAPTAAARPVPKPAVIVPLIPVS